MITQKSNNKIIYLILLLFLFISCRVNNEKINNNKSVGGIRYKIIEAKNENLNIVIDMAMNFSLFKEKIITLGYDNKKDMWTIDITQKHKLERFSDYFVKTGDYVMFYKEEYIFVSSIENNRFNDFFLLKNINDTIINTYSESYNNIVYFTEQYKQNKKFVPASCKYQFKIIDNKIVSLISNCDSLIFNTKEELEKLYGK